MIERLIDSPFFDENQFNHYLSIYKQSGDVAKNPYGSTDLSIFNADKYVDLFFAIFYNSRTIYLPKNYVENIQNNIYEFERILLNSTFSMALGYRTDFDYFEKLSTPQKINFFTSKGREDIVPIMKEYQKDKDIIKMFTACKELPPFKLRLLPPEVDHES